MHHISAVNTSYETVFESTLKAYMIFFSHGSLLFLLVWLKKDKNCEIIDKIELSLFYEGKSENKVPYFIATK
jgi:hypothetical protein